MSVVIPSYERADLLERCLAALARARAAHPEPSFEVLVVDNGSRDESVTLARRSGLGVRVIELGSNRGFAAAANRGLEARQGRHVLLLNSDAEIAPDLILRGLARLETDPSIGILGAALFHSDGRPQRSVHTFPNWTSEILPEAWIRAFRRRGAASERGARQARREAQGGHGGEEALRGAALFLSGELVERIGPFDEGYFFFLEETDYCWRAREAGLRVVLDPSLRVVHQLGASSKVRAPFATRVEFERSLVRFLERRRGHAKARLAVALRLLRFGLALGLFALPAVILPSVRRRTRERAGLVLWHLRGRPAEPSLAGALAAARASTVAREPREAGREEWGSAN